MSRSNLVLIERLNSEAVSLTEQFSRSFKYLSLDALFSKSKAVFIKPNLTYPFYKEGVTTRQEFISALISALRRINNSTLIYVGEGEGGYNSFSMSEAFKQMGFYELENKFPNVKIINLSHMPALQTEIDTTEGPYKITLPEIFFKEIDFSISCPVPKIHCMTRVSLAYKNIWGCVPDTMRIKNHYMFNYLISKISKQLKFQFAFLDGEYGLDNNGPMVGSPVKIGWFVASNSLGAFDVVVSEMMGINWKKVKHLKTASRYDLIPDRDTMRVSGDIKVFSRKFTLKRNFWNYPALIAFNSKRLTQLFYFSKWAKLLHDVMYIFRKHQID